MIKALNALKLLMAVRKTRIHVLGVVLHVHVILSEVKMSQRSSINSLSQGVQFFCLLEEMLQLYVLSLPEPDHTTYSNLDFCHQMMDEFSSTFAEHIVPCLFC